MNYKICITLLLAGTFVSCSKVLDKKPLDAFDENTIWQDKSLADGFVLTTYANVIGGLYFWQATDDMTDNNCNNYGNGVTTENIDNSYDAGWNQYSKIRSCNLIIEKVTASTGIMENDKKVMIAEAKFMRGGITYYYLAQRFGGVMLVDKVLDQNSDDFQLPRSSPETIYEFILKDLSDAALDLPTTAPSGRASKAAAYAFITRVGLQGAAYVPAKKQEYLQSVITAAEKTFTYDYQLDADYAGMFNDFGKAQASREMILAYFRDATNTTFQSTIMQGLCPNAGNEKLNPGFGPRFHGKF
ncbi:MAG: RagB/SusD family nutrient uptake outer membrane protein [Bacteroidota bacterium]